MPPESSQMSAVFLGLFHLFWQTWWRKDRKAEGERDGGGHVAKGCRSDSNLGSPLAVVWNVVARSTHFAKSAPDCLLSSPFWTWRPAYLVLRLYICLFRCSILLRQRPLHSSSGPMCSQAVWWQQCPPSRLPSVVATTALYCKWGGKQ